MKNFTHTDKFKEHYNEHLDALHLDSISMHHNCCLANNFIYDTITLKDISILEMFET